VPISRKDFLNGLAWTAGAAMLPSALTRAATAGPDPSAEEFFLAHGITPQDPRYYPPMLTGMRGSHPGSFEAGHAVRDGEHPDRGPVVDTREHYDLIVVGAGISGLSAAYFFRKLAGPQAKILLLDNHDDFGGHAKRNEFTAGGRTLIGYGGTQNIEVLSLYTADSMGLLKELGIDIKRFEKYYDRDFRKSHGMADACFFDKSAFGADTLARNQVGVDYNDMGFDRARLDKFLAEAPFAPAAKQDFRRLFLEKVDYLPGKTAAQKQALLKRMSLKTFLEQHARVHPEVVKYYQQRPHGAFGAGADAVDALSGMFFMPDAVSAGLGLEGGSISAMMATEPYINHFPDGNASIARLLVRSLVPGSAPGNTMEDIVTARMNYAMLDRPGAAVRIRLNSTAVRVKHVGDSAASTGVEVTYLNAGKAYRARADKVVLACWNMIIPYLCPEMPKAQRDGLAYCVKVPLVYGTVQIRNWHALKKLGVSTVYCAGGYFSEVYMDFPVSIGDYQFTKSPDEPCLLHLVRVPGLPGAPLKDQYRAGRAELFATPFATFEHHVRDQLGRMFGAGGFDPARDIQAITINRWPHGYAYGYSTLWDPEWPPGQEPHVLGRQRFGRIAIANADSGGMAETSSAIDQALRAVREVLPARS
jgi:spermidine dehydrogenase